MGFSPKSVINIKLIYYLLHYNCMFLNIIYELWPEGWNAPLVYTFPCFQAHLEGKGDLILEFQPSTTAHTRVRSTAQRIAAFPEIHCNSFLINKLVKALKQSNYKTAFAHGFNTSLSSFTKFIQASNQSLCVKTLRDSSHRRTAAILKSARKIFRMRTALPMTRRLSGAAIFVDGNCKHSELIFLPVDVKNNFF